ncbi:hypothetical protein V7138_09000 [Bacillus sp. JJ1533]|uniref:hypothetical protein n=1 Tax=Bacillus sp. JJ1533 TaxID=3122959 RepID=UPI002FFFE4EF
MGKKPKKKFNNKQSSKTGKYTKKPTNLQEGTLDKKNFDSPKIKNTFITKQSIGDNSNEWQKIREALPEHYEIPDPDIYKELKLFYKTR